MFVSPKFFITFIATSLWATMAFAGSPTPGNYQTEGDWGSLTVKNGRFKIFAMGANAHSCDLSGKIEGDKGYADSEGETNNTNEQCVIKFTTALNEGVEVKAERGACRSYCGMRAWFEGMYYLPPQGCASSERKAAQNEFKKVYEAKDYSRAYEILHAHLALCSKFMDWVEIDKVRNHLAITQYHLGNKDACLKILQETRAANATDKDDLGLPPADLEAYLPTAQSTWFNMKKCGGQAKAH